jgi:predicted phage terminase large subunit-like protein
MIVEGYKDLDALPRALRIYGASDYATMEPDYTKREPDFTEHGVWGIDAIGELWAVDWWSGQVETDKGIAAFVNFVVQYKPIKWWNEGGLIDKAIGPAIRQAMRLKRRFTVVESMPSIGDKAMKLQAFHALASAKCVHFPIRRPWTEQVIDQLIKFPGGRWDDKADVCGLIGRGVDQMIEAQVSLPERKPLLIPFTEAWLEYNERNEKPKVRYF